MGRVIVVGSINTDLVVTVPRLPAPGETVSGGDAQRFQGGKGANQAVAAARLGAQVVLVGAVGKDEFGRAALDALFARGVRSLLVEGGAEVLGSFVRDRLFGRHLLFADDRRQREDEERDTGRERDHEQSW